MTVPVLVLLGAGPGVGKAVARRFHDAGYRVVLLARDATRLREMVEELRGADNRLEAVSLDLTDDVAVRSAIETIGREQGRIDVLHFNPSAWRQKNPLELTVEELIDDLRLGLTPLLPAVQAARPYLADGARIMVTGSAAADRPWNAAASLGVQKAAVRNLVTSFDTTLAPDGVRAVCVQVNGLLAEEGPFSHANVAQALFDAVYRDPEAWTPQVSYDGGP